MRIHKFEKKFKIADIELKTYYFGVFLLPFTPLISSFILLIVSIFSSFKRKSYFKDNWNIPLFSSGLLIIISCISNFAFSNNVLSNQYEKELIWIGIVNWIPYFWIFWLFQDFSFKSHRRKAIISLLMAGTIPIIILGLMQYFLKVHGPFIFLNGLVTWYSREVPPIEGMTSVFNNANYFGMWLNIIWPFSLVQFLEYRKNTKLRFISLTFLLSVATCTILTFSRNSWLGFLLGTILILGLKSLRWIIPLLILIISPVLTSLGLLPNKNLIDLSQRIVPDIILNQFDSFGVQSFESSIRVQLWTSALNFISQKPLQGWGSSSFPLLYQLENNSKIINHTHNLPLEIALSFGLPTSIIITGVMILLIIFSRKYIYFYKRTTNIINYDIAWWTSSVVILFCHLFDIQYFDIRIGLVLWILLGGLRNILKEKTLN